MFWITHCTIVLVLEWFDYSALYLESTEVDHRESKAEGGYGVLENGAIIHPICNRFKSDRALEEVRADLFD